MSYQSIICMTALGMLVGCAHKNSKIDSAREPSSQLDDFTGYSNYRLFLARRSEAVFDPNQDITKKTKTEQLKVDFREAMEQSLLASLMPIMINVDNHDNLLGGVEASLIKVSKNLRDSIKEIKNSENGHDQKIFPIVEDLYMIPWKNNKKDLFYSAEKISTNFKNGSQILRVDPESEIFSNYLTASIKKLFVSSLNENLDDPVIFLGFISSLHINPYEKSFLRVKMLLGLRPQHNIPFDQKSDPIHIKNAVIPRIKDHGPVASMFFDIDLSSDNPKTATLDVEFGDFEKFSKNEFLIAQKNKSRHAPRLESIVNKEGLGWVGVDFAFDKLRFSLEDLELSNLDTKTSFGINLPMPFFRFKKSKNSYSAGFGITQVKLREGNVSINKVDEEFSKEINNNLDSLKEKAKEDAVSNVFSDKIDFETLKKAFNLFMSVRE